MRKIGRTLLLLVYLWFFLNPVTDVLPEAHAATLTASEACVNFIKDFEGFSSRPYYDYGQHTVGYGTKCPSEKYFDYLANGIPKDEAEALLQETIEKIGENIQNKLIDKYNLALTQHQFDALVSFSFNVGTGWMSYDSTLRNALLTNANENDFVYAFSLYSTAGGTYSSGLVRRRLCEANIFLNGVYSKKPSDTHGYVYYEPNEGSLTYQVQGFLYAYNPVPAADAVRNGDVFVGWYTELTGGTKVTELSKSLAGKTLFARWQSSEKSEVQDSTSIMITVTGDVVNIRKGPGTNYGIAKQVYQNDVLVVSHVTQLSGRNWGKVQDGWICLDYTTYANLINGNDQSAADSSNPPPDTEITEPDNSPVLNDPAEEKAPDPPVDAQIVISGTVRVNDLLRIRSGPGTAYSTVGYLLNDRKVEILEQKTVGSMVWGRISRGWISMDYIITETPAPPEANSSPEIPPEQKTEESAGKTEDTQLQGKVIADALRIRSGPSTVNSILGFYYQNDTIVISEKLAVDSVDWGKTDLGWINMDYVRLYPSDAEVSPPHSARVMTVTGDCLRIRKEIGTDSKIAALLYYGDKITVFETETVDGVTWGRVDKGWICMDYVK